MLTIIASVFYVIIAVAMIVLILLQRGAGAAAGSGFGGGASSTVFGSRGSANFMSRSTAVLAGLFFLLSLGMAIFHAKPGMESGATDDLGIMGRAATSTATETPVPTGDVPQAAPAATSGEAPVATALPADATVPVSTAPMSDAKPAAVDSAKSDAATSDASKPEPAKQSAKDTPKK